MVEKNRATSPEAPSCHGPRAANEKLSKATRKAAVEAAMKEAATRLKLSEMRGMEYQPAQNGFVFSTAGSPEPDFSANFATA
jgi:hypothetical protein